MKKSLFALVACAALTPLAYADGLSANLSLTSKYKYRGQDQSLASKAVLPAVQGGFDYTTGPFYVGNWNSSISGAGTEMDFYGGYKGEVAGFGYDVGLLQYYYPGATSLNTTEVYGGISYGIASAKLSYVASDKYFGEADNRGTLYLDLGANVELMKGVTLNGHVGFTQLDTKGPIYPSNYADYKLGATYDLGEGYSVAGAVVGATKKKAYGDINKTRVVFTLTKSM
jgi:uncharacterized protein (TIGR02001 family)